jgi:hypothetical protein
VAVGSGTGAAVAGGAAGAHPVKMTRPMIMKRVNRFIENSKRTGLFKAPGNSHSTVAILSRHATWKAIRKIFQLCSGEITTPLAGFDP